MRCEIQSVVPKEPYAAAPISIPGMGTDQPGQNSKDMSVQIRTGDRLQAFDGLGAAFSEIGWRALGSLPDASRQEVLRKLFSRDPDAAAFSFCRMPVGASDFALDAYSLDDHPGDYEMEKFSLKRDEECLLKFIVAAKAWNPALRLHASPWSPPAWMKDSGSMVNGGSLIDSPEIRRAYARYLRAFVVGYAAHGVPIDRLFVQNEPDIGTPYPSCIFPSEKMAQFIVNDLAPEFKRSGAKTEIWVGTFRSHTGLQSNECLENSELRALIGGAGFQYCHEHVMNDMRQLHPKLRIMHTESVCHNGENSWGQAMELFNDFIVKMQAGCQAYSYWNMVLDEIGKSSWGWRQNSLVVVDRNSARSTFTPDFEIMKLLGCALRPGSVRIAAMSPQNPRVAAFQRPDKTVVVLFQNVGGLRHVSFGIDSHTAKIQIPGNSVVAAAFTLP